MTMEFSRVLFGLTSRTSWLRLVALAILPLLLLTGALSSVLAQTSTTTITGRTSFGFIQSTGTTTFTTGANGCQDPANPANVGTLSLQFPSVQVPCSTAVGPTLTITCLNQVFVAAGTYQSTATYTGFTGQDSNGAACTVPSSGATQTITVPQTSTSLSVYGPEKPVQQGLTATYSAVISPFLSSIGQPDPSGTISIVYGSQVVASAPVVPGMFDLGAATIDLPTKGIAPGQYSLLMKYSGDVNYTASSYSFLFIVGDPQLSTATALGISPSSLVAGETTTLSVSVAPGGILTPTGTITFLANGAKVATAPLQSGALTFVAPTAGLAPGKYTVLALYGGDTYNLPSTSPPVKVTIDATTPTKTAVTVTPSTLVEGQTVVITATVTQQIGNVVPTGTVVLTENGAPVATLPLKNGTATVSASTAGIAPGTYLVYGTYSGNATANSSQSYDVTVTILNPAVITVTASPNPVVQGNVTTLTATAVDGSGNPITSGSVNFTYSGNTLGTIPLNSAGTAQLPITTNAFAPGTYVIDATFTGTQSIPPATGSVSLVVK